MRINTRKTETLVITKKDVVPRCLITVGNAAIKQVEKFTYLGSDITQDARCTTEIKKRIAMSKKTFSNIKVDKISELTQYLLILTRV